MARTRRDQPETPAIRALVPSDADVRRVRAVKLDSLESTEPPARLTAVHMIAAMSDIREVPEGETHRVAAALLDLRTDAGPLERLIERVDAQRAAGYRVVGAFEVGDEDAQAVIGFKVTENLAWGRYLYIEDVVTRASGRGKGHAPALMSWVLDEGRTAGCASVHLNSGTGADRRGAHRFYFNSGLRIAAHHFAMELA